MLINVRRFFCSLLNVIIIFLLLLVICSSFFSTYAESEDWRVQLGSAEPDITDEAVYEMLNSFRGIGYLGNLFLGGEGTFQLVLALVIGFSVMFGGKTFDALYKGYGNQIITREHYRKYILIQLVSQALYMCVFVILFSLIITSVVSTIMPWDKNYPSVTIMSFTFFSPWEFYRLQAIQVIAILMCVIPLVSLVTVTPLFVRYKYLNMAVPTLIVSVAFVAANTISNYSSVAAVITKYYDISEYLLTLYSYHQEVLNGVADEALLHAVLRFVVPIGTLSVLLFAVTVLNIKKFGRDYLK